MLKEVDLKGAYRVTPTGLYLYSTARGDKRNVQFAFRALGISDDPPLLLVCVQDKNYSLGLIRETREFVLNACSEKQLDAIDKSRGLTGRTVEDKFEALGFETQPAKYVKAPLVKGCHANVECRVLKEMETEGLVIFLVEALACYVDNDLPPVARFAGKTFRLEGPI
ncbi:MAG: flavin reductase family protein [Candidatus Binatia bacterium]